MGGWGGVRAGRGVIWRGLNLRGEWLRKEWEWREGGHWIIIGQR